jgi:hypothetical protein
MPKAKGNAKTKVKSKTVISQYLAEIGRKGGLSKSPKGVALLPPARRSEIAKKAAQARWGKKRAQSSTRLTP